MDGTVARRTRRELLRVSGGALGVSSLLLAACAAPSPSSSPAATSGPAPPASSVPTSQSTGAGTTNPTAASAATVSPGQRGGTLTFGSSADVVSLDPANISDTISQNVFQMLYTPLVKQTPNLDLVPGLATNWTANDRVWTVTLRQGVKFHDGTPFNAAAVKAHADRILGDEKPLLASQWVPYVAAVDVVDDFTVRFTTKADDAFFPNRLTGGVGSIESPAAFQKYGKDLTKNPVGTGPFKFVEWVSGDHVTVARNDDYWGGAPYLDKVITRVLPDPEARAVALEAGDIQLSIAVTPEQMSRLGNNPALALDTVTSTRTLFIGMSALKAPFSDVRVRQALNYAIDKQAIVSSLYQGLAEVLNGMVPQGASGYAEMSGYPFDLSKARQLMADAGYPNGFQATLVGPKGRYLNDYELEQAIQQQLKAIGVDIQLNVVEYAEYLNEIRADPNASPLQMWLDAWSGSNASDIIEMRFGCNAFRPKGANTAGFCDADIDALAVQGGQTFEAAARDSVLQQAQVKLDQAAPAIWLMSLKDVAGRSKKLHNPVESRGDVLTVDETTWLEV
jgi:ABC-type transport system substrate-binding protein